MLRTSRVYNHDLPDNSGQSRTRPQDDAMSRSTRPPVPGSVPLLPETEQRTIYYEWTRAGKPHNLVCSECRKPNHLMLCETCCRSYHAECLPTREQAGLSGGLYCPSCRALKWDRLPPRFASPNTSRSATPFGRDDGKFHSPPGYVMHSRHGSPATSRSPLSGWQSSLGPSSPGIDYQQNVNGSDQTLLSGKLACARQFLIENDDSPPHQGYSSNLLHRLGDVMVQLESYQYLLQEVQTLRDENVRLQHANKELRLYAGSKPSSHEPTFNPPMPHIPQPSPDTSGKSWDSIVMDLI